MYSPNQLKSPTRRLQSPDPPRDRTTFVSQRGQFAHNIDEATRILQSFNIDASGIFPTTLEPSLIEDASAFLSPRRRPPPSPEKKDPGDVEALEDESEKLLHRNISLSSKLAEAQQKLEVSEQRARKAELELSQLREVFVELVRRDSLHAGTRGRDGYLAEQLRGLIDLDEAMSRGPEAIASLYPPLPPPNALKETENLVRRRAREYRAEQLAQAETRQLRKEVVTLKTELATTQVEAKSRITAAETQTLRFMRECERLEHERNAAATHAQSLSKHVHALEKKLLAIASRRRSARKVDDPRHTTPRAQPHKAPILMSRGQENRQMQRPRTDAMLNNDDRGKPVHAEHMEDGSSDMDSSFEHNLEEGIDKRKAGHSISSRQSAARRTVGVTINQLLQRMHNTSP